MPSSQTTFTILYGVAEGRATGQRLRAVLVKMGLREAATPAAANLIISHSGGIIDLPRDVRKKTLIILAPSLSRRYRSRVLTELEKIFRDAYSYLHTGNLFAWLHLTALNTWYLISHPRRLAHLWSEHQDPHRNLPTLNAQTVLVVSYKNDPWSSYMPEGEPRLHPSYQFISLNAAHDDLWTCPERYAMYFEIHRVITDELSKEAPA